MNTRWTPRATVAAIIERDGKFLLVEEHTSAGLRLNNPAGHLEPGETPVQGCIREVLEETAHEFVPRALVGVYLSPPVAEAGAPSDYPLSYLRFAYCGDVGHWHATRALDTGIVRTLWLSADEIRASHAQHRSGMVLQCLHDYLAGQRYPLELVQYGLGVPLPPATS